MPFNRPEGFEVDISKTVKFLDIEDDPLMKNPDEVFATRKFKIQAFSSDNCSEFLYDVANGQNVVATFERIQREILDLHYIGKLVESKQAVIPVVRILKLEASKSDSEIEFLSRHNPFRDLRIGFKLKDGPKSVLPNVPRGKTIRMTINRKIPDSMKLTHPFNTFLSDGLLLNFLNDTIWPMAKKLAAAEKEEFRNFKNAHRNERGQNRAPGGPESLPSDRKIGESQKDGVSEGIDSQNSRFSAGNDQNVGNPMRNDTGPNRAPEEPETRDPIQEPEKKWPRDQQENRHHHDRKPENPFDGSRKFQVDHRQRKPDNFQAERRFNNDHHNYPRRHPVERNFHGPSPFNPEMPPPPLVSLNSSNPKSVGGSFGSSRSTAADSSSHQNNFSSVSQNSGFFGGNGNGNGNGGNRVLAGFGPPLGRIENNHNHRDKENRRDGPFIYGRGRGGGSARRGHSFSGPNGQQNWRQNDQHQ